MNPYQTLEARAFWRSAVAERAGDAVDGLWTPKWRLDRRDAIATAGSCFAQHIGRALSARGMHWLDAEPTPAGLAASERADRQYGVFSFRTGNLYTAAGLLQWMRWALDEQAPPDEVWWEGARCFDPLRPSADPAGFACEAELRQARTVTLRAIRQAVTQARCFVFTLGLTEAWEDQASGTVYPVCPGTVRGTFDPARHGFRNAGFQDVYRDLAAAIDLMRQVNPGLRVLLTVSPVPLTATASGQHVLPATVYSKSVLRAVAGQLAQEREEVDYFPSFELVTAFPFGAAAFEPNLRTVSPAGVEFVMRHFFDALRLPPLPVAAPGAAGEDFFCDDAVLDYYRPG